MPSTMALAKDSPTWFWSKTSTASQEETWEERLAFLPPGAVVFLYSPGSQAMRIKVYTDASTAEHLRTQFGGTLKQLLEAEWTEELQEHIKPLSIRGQLLVFSQQADWKKKKSSLSKKLTLWIPAAMAFGTGNHPTTAGCLRRLYDESVTLAGQEWRQADIGTGSGILALAGHLFGATYVEAFDYDPVCVRVTKRNAQANHIHLDRISTADVHQWQAERPCHIITANLFSDTLISAAHILSTSLLSNGCLIFSGVLREQLPEVALALEKQHLYLQGHNARGKWICGIARKN